MFEKKETLPLLPLVSPSPPPSTFSTDIHNYEIEEKMSTTPTTLPTSPVPASPTPRATSTWTTPAIGERSQEAQTRMLLAAQAADHAARQRNGAILIHIIWAITVIVCLRHAGPLIIFLFKQVMAAFGLEVVIVRKP